MTLTVSINRVGIVHATQILQQARNDAARRQETGPQTVSVELDGPSAPGRDVAPDRVMAQARIVDIQI